MNPQETKKTRKPQKPQKPLTQDQKLQQLFADTPTPTSSFGGFTIQRKKTKRPAVAAATTPKCPPDDGIARYFANRNSRDVLYFKHSGGDAMLGHPSRPVLDRQCAFQYSEHLLEAAKESEQHLIVYESSIEEVTIARFVACISPSLRKDLPTHDIVEIGKEELQTTKIQWSMQELKDLYIFAEEMQAWDVVDMVTDRLHTELHRPYSRIFENEYGEKQLFDILDFSPGFMHHLAGHDPTGLDLFTDILVMKGQDGWQHLLKYGLRNWDYTIKQTLIQKLLDDHEPNVTVKDEEHICKHFHRHHEYDGYVCYKTEGPTASVVEVALEDEEEDLSPVASHWKRQDDLCKEMLEAQRLQTQGSKRKRPTDEQDALDSATASLKDRTKQRRRAEKALSALEASMPCIAISCFHERVYDEFDIYAREQARAQARAAQQAAEQEEPEPVATPAFPGGFIYPAHLGNGKKDSRRQANGKMKEIRKKLAEYQKAGYDVGDIAVE